MSVQTSYGNQTPKGVAGGIYDMFHYAVDSRFNEETDGVLRFGVGVVPGTLPGSSVKLPAADRTTTQFEGVVLNGYDRQQDLSGKLFILNNQNIGVMRRGRVWVRLAADAAPKYGDEVRLMTSGDDVGCFSTTGGLTIPGRFIGPASNGVAPVELYGTGGAAAAAD